MPRIGLGKEGRGQWGHVSTHHRAREPPGSKLRAQRVTAEVWPRRENLRRQPLSDADLVRQSSVATWCRHAQLAWRADVWDSTILRRRCPIRSATGCLQKIGRPNTEERTHREPDPQRDAFGDRPATSSTLVLQARSSGDSGSGRPLMKRMLIAATTLALAGTLSGCVGDDEPKAEPTPGESASASASESNTPDPTWDDEFSPAQLKSYRAARDRWLEFWHFYTEITRKGEDTPGVKSGFEKYTMFSTSEYSSFLDSYVRSGARMDTPPEVLWTSATKIGKDRVDFNYCLDNTNIRITVNGQVTPQEPPYRVLRTVRMRNTAKGWLLQVDLNAKGVETCPQSAP